MMFVKAGCSSERDVVMNCTLDLSAASSDKNAMPTPESDSAALAFSANMPGGESRTFAPSSWPSNDTRCPKIAELSPLAAKRRSSQIKSASAPVQSTLGLSE